MEANIEMETKHCDNCKKDVPVGNYLNHSIHCPRNIRLCPKCDEPYPIIEMDRHLAKDHEEVVCPECYEFMEAIDLPVHQAESCPKRMVSCIICEVDLPACDLGEHLDYCGSRSDRCDGCGKTVLMKYQQFHLSTRHALTKPENEKQFAESTHNFFNQYNKLSGQQESGTKSASKPSTTTSKQSSSSSKTARPPANTSQSSNKFLVDVTSSSSSLSNVPALGVGVSTSGLATPSSSVLAMLEPVFTAPSIVPRTPATTPSSNDVAPLSNDVAPSSVEVSRAIQNVDMAIKECVDSICAGLKVSSKTPSSVTGSNNPRGTPMYTNGTGATPLSCSNIGTPGPSGSVDSCASGMAPNSGRLNLVNAQHASHNATASSASSRSLGVGPLNVSSTAAERGLNSGVDASTASRLISGQSKAPTVSVADSSSNSTVASSTNSSRCNSSRGILTSQNNQDSSAPYNLGDGAGSLQATVKRCTTRQIPRSEVLLPQSSVPRMTPVHQSAQKTRKREFADDALNDYMLRLEEQGLSGGLSSNFRQSTEERKPCAEVSASTTSRNAIRERVALIRREREEKLAEARANNRPLCDTPRPHITEALNLTNAAEPDDPTSLSLPNGATSPPSTNGASGVRSRRARDPDELWSDYLEALPTARSNSLLKKLTRAMPSEPDPYSPPALTRPAHTRTRPSNFAALTHPRPRRDNEVLTRAELRGLNDTLETDRQAFNREIEDETGLCLPCEFCDAPIPMDHLILHQTGCRPDLIYH